MRDRFDVQGCCPAAATPKMPRTPPFVAALVLVLLSAACGREAARAADSAAAVARVAEAQRSSPRPPASSTGLWDADHVEERLDRAGLAPVRDSVPARQPFMRVPGVVFHVGSAELQVYVYPDSASRARDTGALDTLTVSPPSAPVQWSASPSLIVSNNVAAILLADNLRQRERVRLALEAGLPVERR